MSIAKRGSIYDKVINEEWFSTPDMGEYYNNLLFKQKAMEQSENKENPMFFIENPPVESTGYYEELGVLAVRGNVQALRSKFMDTYHTEYNMYDGDTIYLSLDSIANNVNPFQVYYSDTVFNSTNHYLEETLDIQDYSEGFGIRFVGFNSPEIVHYVDFPCSLNDDDICKIKYSQLTGTGTTVNSGLGVYNKNVFAWRPYNISTKDNEYVLTERSGNEELTFLKVQDIETKKYSFHEVISTEKTDDKNRKIRKCVIAAETHKDLEYHKASFQARDIVKNAFNEATDCIVMLDTCSLNGKKSSIPDEYRKSFENSKKNPFYSLYEIWKSLKGHKAAYKYASYRAPGQEANGRFLGAVYLKINGQWINLNKKVMYECEMAEPAEYSSSVDHMVNGYYLAKGFKLWTYDKNKQLYIDDINEDVYKSKDDREKIQQDIAGCDLKQMTNHTMMIGDTLFMVPPTSIRAISQTKTSKLHLLRAKGAMSRTLPKTERLIQLELFFNGDQAINGIPYEQTLPNGIKKTYYMNGLRGLMAQFKLAPFLPIHNDYINNTLNITAVSLSNYTISTVPNYPRTLQVTLMMQEFDWTQYMPCQAVPDNMSENGLYKNGFSDTIHFPLLRYYYQRAIERGEELMNGDFKNILPNDKDYIEATIGNKTSLQPMKFTDPLIDFYVPNQNLLAARKQAISEMKTKPLGRKFNFTNKEYEWIAKANALNEFMQKSISGIDDTVYLMTSQRQDKLNTYLSVPNWNKSYSYQEAIKGESAMIQYGTSGSTIEKNKVEVAADYMIPMFESVRDIYNELKSALGDIITGYDLRTSTSNKNKKHQFKISIVGKLNKRFLEDEKSLDTIREYCAKQIGKTAKELFKDDEVVVSFVSEFAYTAEASSNQDRISYVYKLNKPFLLDSDNNASLEALSYLAALTDSAKEGFDDFDINKIMENLKDSIDIEDSESIKFEKFEIGNPIITAVSSSYNNMFANVSLKAVDGHAAQYTGGSDSSFEVEMIADEFSVGQLYFLNRLCVKNLIDYRKVIKSSPLRIDSDISRMLGIYEVIIDTLDINTIPDIPGKFKVIMKLSSVDRTLRNREALKKLSGTDNHSTQKDPITKTKNFFDLKQVLGKAEIYPDLELPTIEELEKAGFFFLKNKYQAERVYPDPDFYFLYWYPTLANNIRTSIVEFFENPENFQYKVADSSEMFTLDMVVKNNNGKALFEVLNWEDRDKTYDNIYKSLDEKLTNTIIYHNGKEDDPLTDSEKQTFKEVTSARLDKLEQCNKVLNKLQESVDNSIYNTYQVNTLTNITVRDIDVMDVESDADYKAMQVTMNRLKSTIIEILKKPCGGYYEDGSPYDCNLFFKPANYNDFKGKNDSSHTGSDQTMGTGNGNGGANSLPVPSGIIEIAQALLDNKDLNFYEHSKYVSHIIKAGAVGSMATQPFFTTDKKLIKEGYKGATTDVKSKEEPLCYPPKFALVTNENGEEVKRPICLYPDSSTSELLMSHNEETDELGIVFGRYGIRKYDKSYLARAFKNAVPFEEDGFLDPYYNRKLAKLMFVDRQFGQKPGDEFKDLSEEENILESISKYKTREKDYIKGITNDVVYAHNAYFRQMLVWLYILIEEGSFINLAHHHAVKLVEIGKNADKFWDNEKLEELSKSLFDEGDDTYEAPSALKTVCNAVKDWRYKDEFDQLLGEGAYSNTGDAIKTQEEKIKEILKTVQDNSENYAKTLVVGMFYTLGAIAMSGFESVILQAVSSGNMTDYSQSISNAMGAVSIENFSEEQKKLTRFTQYLAYYFDEDERMITSPIQAEAYNNRVQRAYLKAANDPKTYMLHSFYDMVMNDKRGSMARAFPTHYMLLIDEGREIGLWKLQDNFYDMNSIIEFEVVKSRKMAADTARIVMTNMYGTFNTDDYDQKDEYEYNMKDVWDSVFSPRKYFQEEYMRRNNAREVNTTKMQPGARVHLRMGYSSNAAELPIIFNGSVAEFEAGEAMTLICQGDGVELANPHMFNPADGTDIQDLKHSDKFFGVKQIAQTWDNLSTPRDMLVYPLAAEGTWIQELIREHSDGRFFNSNPFGIVHFGDRRFNSIFTTHGEVEQNIYEALSKPAWNYKDSGIDTIEDGIEKEYSLAEAPRVKVSLKSGLSYWDMMHIASGLSPDFISSIAPFQMRSTVFHGHPRFYYAYDYMNFDGRIVEKRKPFQQYHMYTSYGDIIDNKITTSQTDIRTNAVGHFTGPGWISKKPRTVGPLFVDIDIFPEYQKSTSVNLNFEYKNNDIVPFTVPVVDKVVDMFDWTSGPNGDLTAWRSTASELKKYMKDMYKGELIIMGDPTVKPYDRMVIQDVYEDIGGMSEVEQVVHMFSVDTGFTTSITPDLITAVDNKYETVNNGIISQSLASAVLSTTMLVATNLNFHSKNRPLYLGIARATKHGQQIVSNVVGNAMSTVGKAELQRDAVLINSNIENKALKGMLGITDEHIKLVDSLKDMIDSVKFFNPATTIAGSKDLVRAIENFEKLDDIFKSLDDDAFRAIDKMLDIDMFNGVSYDKAILESVRAAQKNAVFASDDIAKMIKGLESLKTDDALKAAKLLKNADGTPLKSLSLTDDAGKAFLSAFKKAGSKIDDFTVSGLDDIAKLIGTKADDLAKGLKAVEKLGDTAKAAGSVKAAKSALTMAGGLVSTVIMLMVDLCLTKSAQNFLTNKLRNLQVLTIYPLKKENMVWTAGINGHQGSVVGSPSYEEPGWLENLAIKFFDFGSDSPSWTSGSWYLGALRDMFITTPEMKEIVDGYKRGNNYMVNADSQDKLAANAQSALLEKLAKQQTLAYSDYKQIYYTSRLKISDISSRNEEASRSYALYKLANIRDISTTTKIANNLTYILEDPTIKRLYDNDAFLYAADFDKNLIPSEYENLNLKKVPILTKEGSEHNSHEVFIKEINDQAPPVFDIPYLRNDALIVFKNILHYTLKKIEPTYQDSDCNFEKIKQHPIIFHSGTKVNDSSGWRSTGYLFTFEVKNYDNLSNIIKEIEDQRDGFAKDMEVEIPFTIEKENDATFGNNACSVFVHCPLV